MPRLHPEIAAHDHGLLNVGDGHRIHWEVCGNPQGRPALVVHGGPGSGRSETARRYFDPAFWRIVLFDQRGCGRSLPFAGEPDADFSANTTDHLIADMERLRRHLGIDTWLVLGGSWGATLALAYAERHPDRVSALVLHSVALTTDAEIGWITRGIGTFFPEAFERFLAGLPPEARDGDLAEGYHQLLTDPEPAIRRKAARDWCDWEMAIVGGPSGPRPHARYDDPAFRLAFARLVTHYWRHRGFLADGQMMADIGRVAGIPGEIVHGRLDIGNPLGPVWRLHKAFAASRLTVVETAGHDARHAGLAEAIVGAVQRLA